MKKKRGDIPALIEILLRSTPQYLEITGALMDRDVGGCYDPDACRITINANIVPEKFGFVLMHEFCHHVALNCISGPQRKVFEKRIAKILGEIKKSPIFWNLGFDSQLIEELVVNEAAKLLYVHLKKVFPEAWVKGSYIDMSAYDQALMITKFERKVHKKIENLSTEFFFKKVFKLFKPDEKTK